jgi:hypothetical protein
MNTAGGFALIFILPVIYIIPLIVALIRKVPNTGSVAVINILLGWTLVGWAVALAMACRSHPQPVVVNQQFQHPPYPYSQPPQDSAGQQERPPSGYGPPQPTDRGPRDQ